MDCQKESQYHLMLGVFGRKRDVKSFFSLIFFFLVICMCVVLIGNVTQTCNLVVATMSTFPNSLLSVREAMPSSFGDIIVHSDFSNGTSTNVGEMNHRICFRFH